MPATVVKRTEGKEPFDQKKLYASVFVVCTKTDREKQACEKIAEDVTADVADQVEEREQVQSVEIRMWTRDRLEEIDNGLAERYYTQA